MEIMFYATPSGDDLEWGIYIKGSDALWHKRVTCPSSGMSGLIQMIVYALEYLKDARYLLGGLWYNHEQLTEKLYRLLDNNL